MFKSIVYYVTDSNGCKYGPYNRELAELNASELISQPTVLEKKKNPTEEEIRLAKKADETAEATWAEKTFAPWM